MTESEWKACSDPTPMIDFLRGKASDRKLRLFGVACCHRIWHLFLHEGQKQLVELAEQFSDGLATDLHLTEVRQAYHHHLADDGAGNGDVIKAETQAAGAVVEVAVCFAPFTLLTTPHLP